MPIDENRIVRALLRDGSVISIDVHLLTEGNHQCIIEYLGFQGVPQRAGATDFFAAMQVIRQCLESEGCQLLCNGARIDVWPSAIARDMGYGRRAYVTRQGFEVSRDDLVDVFDEADPDKVGTVAQQDAYIQEWFTTMPLIRKQRAAGESHKRGDD